MPSVQKSRSPACKRGPHNEWPLSKEQMVKKLRKASLPRDWLKNHERSELTSLKRGQLCRLMNRAGVSPKKSTKKSKGSKKSAKKAKKTKSPKKSTGTKKGKGNTKSGRKTLAAKRDKLTDSDILPAFDFSNNEVTVNMDPKVQDTPEKREAFAKKTITAAMNRLNTPGKSHVYNTATGELTWHPVGSDGPWVMAVKHRDL